MRLFNLAKVLFVCLLISGLAHAQGVGASGGLKGLVTDPSGATVANATVIATDVAKGTKRTVSSDSNGEFQIPGLLPSAYSVTVSKTGFQSEIAKSLVVNVGQTVVQDFHMKLSQVSESVEVTTEVPVVETERTSQSDVINQQYIEDLPINRRDYLTYTLLAPGVSDSTHLASDQDFRVKQTPQSGLSFYGSNGRGNSVTIDGGEANDDAGGVRTTMSQEAVQEFQINRSNYGAELGGASGATVNIVTKSGGNAVHGSLFGFFRNDALDASNPFSLNQALTPGQVFNPAVPINATHVKDSLNREQFGASIGFPIKKDKTFLFGAFEGLMQDAQNAVPILTSTSIFNPTGADQALIGQLAAHPAAVPCLSVPGNPTAPPIFLPGPTCAFALTSILTVNPFAAPNPFLSPGHIALNGFLVNQLETNGGLFNFNTRQYLASTRFDHQFSDKNQVFLRYSFGHDREESPDVQSLTGFSRGSSIHSLDHTLLASWFHQFSGKTLNEARVQYDYDDFNVLPNAPGEVGLDIPGTANLGNQIFIPSLTIMRRYEFADNFSVIKGKHALKFGGYELLRGNHTESHTFFPGRFVFGNLPGAVLSPCLQFPAACALTAPATQITPLQSASLGAPQFYQQGFGNPTYTYTRPLTSFYAQDNWSLKQNFTVNLGVRYEIDQQPSVLHTSYNNFAPRVSFAWDPFSDKKTVIRAGYGIFYSPIYGQIADVAQTLGVVNGVRQIAQIFVPLTGSPGNPALTSAVMFGNLFAEGKISPCTVAPGQAACITPADLTQFGIAVTHTGPVPPLSVVFSGQPNYKAPYSQQAEFGIDREIGAGFSVSLSGIYVHTIGLPVAIDQNDLTTAPITSVPLQNGSVASFRNFAGASCAGAGIVTCFANPLLLQNNVYSSKGSALYEGGILEIRKRVSHHFSLFANYTFSKAFDTTTDFNSDFGPQDNTNLSGERGLSDFDQRHKVVFLSIIDTGNGGGHALFSGFQISPIFRYNSGHPFDLLAGADVNGDRHSTNDRPIGVARNTGLGPDFFSFDMRLSRAIKLGERAQLQFMAEGFNLANRTNYSSVNNTLDPNFLVAKSVGGDGNLTANVKGSASLSPTQPLGFTSALAKRQIQLGLRATF
jgi:Carboxypeptidase regulatory-like domain